MVFLKVVLVGLASPRGLTVQCFPQEYFSPTPPFHFRCVGPYILDEACHVDVFYQAIVTHRFHQRLLPIISVGHRGSVGGPLGDGVSGQPKAKPEV